MELRLYLLEVVNATSAATDPQQSIYFGVATLLIVLFCALALVPVAPSFMPPRARTFLGRPALFYAAAFMLIAWLRLPGLLSSQLNPDEGQFTAAAAKLLVDPVFWRSVDTGSSGPLNIYPLTVPHLVGWFPDFASSRLIGLLMLIASVLLLHAALSCRYSDASARLALIPLVFTVALVQNHDYVHYSSEHGPVFLLSVGLYLVSRISTRPLRDQSGSSVLAGFSLGLLPYTKMQGAPMAAALALVFFHLVWTDYRLQSKVAANALVCFALGLLLPTAAAMILIYQFDLWQLFWESYIQNALLFYSDFAKAGSETKFTNFRALVNRSLHEFYPLVAATIFVAGCYLVNATYLWKRRSPAKSTSLETPTFVIYSFVYLFAAAFAVWRPGNSFLHYTLLLLPPLGLLLGVTLGEVERQLQKMTRLQVAVPPIRWAMVAGVLLLISAYRVVEVYRVGNPYLRDASKFLEEYRGPVSAAILEVADAGSTMTIWGWRPELYVETKLTQATRYGMTFWQAERNPLQARFLAEFVNELKSARPAVFVDAMSPQSFYYWTVKPEDRAKRQHEAFPALHAIVSADYELVREVEGVRIYRLKSPT